MQPKQRYTRKKVSHISFDTSDPPLLHKGETISSRHEFHDREIIVHAKTTSAMILIAQISQKWTILWIPQKNNNNCKQSFMKDHSIRELKGIRVLGYECKMQ